MLSCEEIGEVTCEVLREGISGGEGLGEGISGEVLGEGIREAKANFR